MTLIEAIIKHRVSLMITNNISDFIKAVNPQGAILAIDYGAKKVGIAVSDIYRSIAMPLQVITYQHDSKDLLHKKIQDLIVSHNVAALAVGIPLKLSGEKSEQTFQTQEFAELLAMKTSLPVLLYDERYTSKLANNLLKNLGKNRKKRNSMDDQVSAVIILEGVLESIKNFKKYEG